MNKNITDKRIIEGINHEYNDEIYKKIVDNFERIGLCTRAYDSPPDHLVLAGFILWDHLCHLDESNIERAKNISLVDLAEAWTKEFDLNKKKF